MGKEQWQRTRERIRDMPYVRSYPSFEGTFLGAEKAIELYLAGVFLGGPDMYSVSSFIASLIEERVGVDCGTVKGPCSSAIRLVQL